MSRRRTATALATVVIGSALLVPGAAPQAAAVAPGLNGRLLVVSNPVSANHRDIVTMDADGTDRVNLTGESQAYLTYGPEASPDGRWIVYQRGTGGEQDSIWKMRSDGTEKTRLTNGVTPDAQPTWSPDGTRIAFVRSQQIWTMDADGTNAAAFHTEGGSSWIQPEWSPDGATIAFVQISTISRRIWTKPVTGGTASARTANVAEVRGPSWSPDGSKLLHFSTPGGVPGLYTTNLDGSGTSLLAEGTFGSYAWSPEGDRIVYTSSVTGNPEAWVMDADGTDATQVTTAGAPLTHQDATWMTPPAADQVALPDLVQGQAMTPIQLQGAVGATFAVTGGNLPSGVALSADGLLTGTPADWGDSVFEVTATGAPTTVVPYRVHVVDPDDPIVNVTNPAPYTSASHPTTTSLQHPLQWVGFDTTSGVASYDVRYRRAKWSGSFGGFTLPATWQARTSTSLTHALTRGYTYCYSARATDLSARTGAWGTERCTIAPLDQTATTRSSGWTTKTSSGYFDGSAWTTTTRDAKLTRTGARLKRVGVLATTCPTCGKVDVYVGSTRIGRISLARGTKTVNRIPILLPVFSLRSGTIRIKVVTSGRTVRIDGVLVGAR